LHCGRHNMFNKRFRFLWFCEYLSINQWMMTSNLVFMYLYIIYNNKYHIVKFRFSFLWYFHQEYLIIYCLDYNSYNDAFKLNNFIVFKYDTYYSITVSSSSKRFAILRNDCSSYSKTFFLNLWPSYNDHIIIITVSIPLPTIIIEVRRL